MAQARLLRFTTDQIEEYIRRFPWDDNSLGGRFQSVLQVSSELRGLAEIPILLTLLVLLCQHETPEALPNRREEIYQLLMDMLLGGWDRAKSVRRLQAVKDSGARLAILREVSLGLYSEHRRAFTKDQFAAKCSTTAPGRKLEPVVVQQLFDNLVQDCIIVPYGRDEYSFFHLSARNT